MRGRGELELGERIRKEEVEDVHDQGRMRMAEKQVTLSKPSGHREGKAGEEVQHPGTAVANPLKPQITAQPTFQPIDRGGGDTSKRQPGGPPCASRSLVTVQPRTAVTESVPAAASQHSQAKAAEGSLLTHETQEQLTPGRDAGLLGAQVPRLFCSSTALGSPLLRRSRLLV